MSYKRTIQVAALLVAISAVEGCGGQDPLTDKQKFDMAKQCIDFGMWPDVYQYKVTCNAVPKS